MTGRRVAGSRIALHGFLIIASLLWLLPVLWALYTSLRPYAETAEFGYVSLPRSLSLDNYTNAWSNAELPKYLRNTLLITIPAVILTLAFASFVAFVVARYSFKFNIALLVLFTAGNLLPQQVLLTPLFRLYLRLPLPGWLSDNGVWYDTIFGLVAINVAFQVGFCAFVMSNYMRTIPRSLSEAALIDGAGAFRQYWSVIMPLCRPVLAALATLEFTWIYNDFLWAVVLMKSGDKRPITSALANLSGQFFTDNNLVAAGSILIALPTMLVYFVLQKHFIGGLTLGASKG